MVTEPYWDLRKGSFSEGWEQLFPKVRQQKPTDAYICADCEIYSLCGQCPGWAMTENNNTASPVEYLCRITRERAKALGLRKNNLAELALRFGSDLADPIEQSHRNSELFRGVCE